MTSKSGSYYGDYKSGDNGGIYIAIVAGLMMFLAAYFAYRVTESYKPALIIGGSGLFIIIMSFWALSKINKS